MVGEKYAYSHLLEVMLGPGEYDIERAQVSHPEIVLHSIRCESVLRDLSWEGFALPHDAADQIDSVLTRAGKTSTTARPRGG